jgi:hypothetical protein
LFTHTTEPSEPTVTSTSVAPASSEFCSSSYWDAIAVGLREERLNVSQLGEHASRLCILPYEGGLQRFKKSQEHQSSSIRAITRLGGAE